ncbi:MAG TPA: methyl-accepting chemotaxis protein, partial [bacterium]|nr:methyl-accepting chemotaxis protein [bacterium]
RQRQVIDEQNSLSVQASGNAEEVTRASSEIKERAHSTQYQMDEVAVATQEADTTLGEVSKIIQDMMDHSELIWTKMENLESKYRRMEEVVKIIDDIAERTEMLSLNAALEAGTRTEVGDRLSVVATEVQRLSERISEQTADIRALFNEIRRASMEMAQAIDVARARAQEGPQWLKRLTDSLRGIENRARAAAGSMAEIVNMTGEQGQALEQMKILISEIQAVASVIDEVSAGAESTMERLNSLAGHLRQLVEEKG